MSDFRHKAACLQCDQVFEQNHPYHTCCSSKCAKKRREELGLPVTLADFIALREKK